jgi:hypothetical protein
MSQSSHSIPEFKFARLGLKRAAERRQEARAGGANSGKLPHISMRSKACKFKNVACNTLRSCGQIQGIAKLAICASDSHATACHLNYFRLATLNKLLQSLWTDVIATGA